MAPDAPDVTIYYNENFAGFPDACRLVEGDILVAFREDTIHMESETGRTVCARSSDGGRSWSDPVVVCDFPGVDDRDPRIMGRPDGSVWVGVMGQDPVDYPLHNENYLVRSYDGGRTWEEPVKIAPYTSEEPAEEVLWEPPVQYWPTYPECELSDGSLLWTGFAVRGRRTQRHQAGLRCTFFGSEEDGRFSWTPHIHPDLGGSDEWSVVETEPGRLVAILRQQPAHYYYQSASTDHSRTFEPARPTTIWQGPIASRPKLYRVDDFLLVAYAERANHRVVAVPSLDGGRTWRSDKVVTVIESERYCCGYDFGYPAVVEVDEGTLLFVYYAYPGKESPHRGIYGNFVPKKLFTR